MIARATTLGEGSADVQADASWLYLALGEPVAALAYGERAISLDPGSARASFGVGAAQVALGHPNAAISSLLQAVKSDPYSATYYQKLAQAYEAAGLAAAADKTTASMSALRASVSAPAKWPKVAKVAVALGADVVVSLLLVLVFSRRSRRVRSGEPPAGARPPELASLIDALAVLGIWAVLIPWLGPAFGYAPESVLRLELADHVVPGLLVIGLSLLCLPRVVSGVLAEWRGLPIVCAADIAAGMWMVAAHAPLLVQAAQRQRSWNLALFHSSAAFGVLAMAAYLAWRVGSERAGRLHPLGMAAPA
jgi:tetratricopeptide (TPR) repeat protein